MSRVDVIVPCYKYAHFLRGVRRERPRARRWTKCVSSSSTTPCRTIRRKSPRSWPEADPRVEWRRHGVNRGHIATYNEGLDWADGRLHGPALGR